MVSWEELPLSPVAVGFAVACDLLLGLPRLLVFGAAPSDFSGATAMHGQAAALGAPGQGFVVLGSLGEVLAHWFFWRSQWLAMARRWVRAGMGCSPKEP